MDVKQFKEHGKEMVEYVCNYYENIHERRVVPDVMPGYLAPLLPKEAPQKGEEWSKILKDIDEKIMQGVTHWQHPRFHAYFPNGNSFASILGDILSSAIGCVGFSWAASPACTELETIVLDWFGKAINLPPEFLFHQPGSIGGGVIQSSASECILVSMLAAREQAIRYLMKKDGVEGSTDSGYLPKLVAYCSKEAHSCVEKDAMISLVRLRTLETDDNGSMRGETLKDAIDTDIRAGLHPFFVLATLGTTGSCSFDKLVEIGKVVENLPACWFHIDAAYSGSGFICPENRYLMEGIHYAHSFNTNCNKWLLVCYDCSCLWVKDRKKLTSALTVDPIYLQHENSKVSIDYRHWSIPLSRRFRSLKLWFTLRIYGIEGLQKHIRNHCMLAKYFEELVRMDDRFEVCNEVKLGLVCFKLKGSDRLNQELLSSINGSGELHMIPTVYKGSYVIRFCVVYEHSTHELIDKSWSIIQKHATSTLEWQNMMNTTKSAEVRRLSRMHSFTRTISKELYEKSSSRGSLYDGATPIVVPADDDDDDDENSSDVFSDENEKCE